ncbi:uncharacterized aarF domain-containing protein kinase 2 isoform X2 [Clupea harengus]|uniref:Uncharacterized aarF domain-containing protein kinase 2 isoform X2 n=1 Tax=Clupea harengus TaxID=7950 RepID=A0A6P8FC61_CLUHA|nr:uncharacterized aarF domain-containing protein kinase 2 isoform X2 [Clupea harengus]
MAALTARSCLQNLRCSVRQLGLFTATRLAPHGSRLVECRAAPLLTRVPKIALLCWGAGQCISTAASCQETLLPQLTAERKSIARVQVHKLVFVLRLSLRAVVLLLKFGPLLLLFPLSWVSQRWASRWLDALLWVTETSGPTFIKLGQWASTRRDIFSQAFCDRFSRLHVHVRPHSWAHTKRCLTRAFGEHWRQLFVIDRKEPVGSGCIAQVYQAKARVGAVEDPAFQQLVEDLERDDLLEAWEIPGLGGTLSSLQGTVTGEEEPAHQTGEEKAAKCTQREPPENEHFIPVAIKVLHPGIRGQVEIDLLLMRAGSWLLNCLPGVKWLSLPEIVEEFEKLMTKQIDLRYEANNIEKFRENFRDVNYVKFPIPLRPFVTRTVLVETYEESEPISRYLQGDVPLELKQRIARMGVDTLLKMVFVDNFVHGDLHPGNILVQGNQTSSSQDKATLTDLWDTVVVSVRPSPPPLQLVLLDAGIVAQLSESDMRNFRDVFTAVVLRQLSRPSGSEAALIKQPPSTMLRASEAGLSHF